MMPIRELGEKVSVISASKVLMSLLFCLQRLAKSCSHRAHQEM